MMCGFSGLDQIDGRLHASIFRVNWDLSRERFAADRLLRQTYGSRRIALDHDAAILAKYYLDLDDVVATRRPVSVHNNPAWKFRLKPCPCASSSGSDGPIASSAASSAVVVHVTPAASGLPAQRPCRPLRRRFRRLPKVRPRPGQSLRNRASNAAVVMGRCFGPSRITYVKILICF